ncbi:MAG: glycosyltransferase family 2 protein [Alphaproteobacteria bacterium]|nr:glycosyltransferase family 2 protein [Alphaproteobacteria bacterium]
MRLSVFVTSYNQKHLLPVAIDSILAQTRPADEIVIVDDASSDGSQDLIRSYEAAHPGIVRPVLHERNTGVAQARIDALNKVTGDSVTYVDGDDRFLPEKLELEERALVANPRAGIAFSNNRYQTYDLAQTVSTWIENEPVPQGDVFFETFTRSFPKRSLFRMEMVRTAEWRRIGFHDPNLNIYEDFDMRIRLTKQLKAVYVDAMTAEIRSHQMGLSKSAGERHIACLRYVYDKNLHLTDDLDPPKRKAARRALAGWISRVGARATLDALQQGRPMTAVKCGLGTGRMLLGRLL